MGVKESEIAAFDAADPLAIVSAQVRWVIGDLHGMLGPLETLLDAIRREDRAPTLFFVGDFVNRGAEVRRTIDLLLALDNARFIRGNHDDIFDLVLHGRCYADNATEGNRLVAFQWFMDHGMDDTFASYGAQREELRELAQNPSMDRLLELVQVVPESHRQFIRGLPALIEESDMFVVHGKWGVSDPSELPSLGVQLATRASLRHRILWGRYTSAEVTAPKTWERVGYFGHTPVTHYIDAKRPDDLVPVRTHQMVLVDTAAALYAAGRLTAYCADAHYYVQADRYGHAYRSNGRREDK